LSHIIRHGDVDIIPISQTSLKTIPDGTKTIGKIVMHGESGNKHLIQHGQVLLLKNPIDVEIKAGSVQVEKFLHIPQNTTISHEEHQTLEIPKGDYVVLQEYEMDHLEEVERSVLD